MAHYFSSDQDSDLDLKKINIKVRNLSFELYSGSGVFSKDRLDKGSELLIERSIASDGWRVLDLGCGYGPVGISIKMLYPKASVEMCDVNKRAVHLAKLNIGLHGLDGISAYVSDQYEKVEGEFDTILLNPPQTAGKDICFSMIRGSINHLRPGGLLQIVARHSKGGETLLAEMIKVFGAAETVARQSGYRIYASQKRQ